MRATKYHILKELIEELKKTFNFVSTDKLRVEIIKNIGGDERTIRSSLSIMRETGLIKDTQNGWRLI